MEYEQKYEAIWRIRYAMRFGRRQAKLFDRVAKGMRFVMLFTGTAAFVTAFGINSTVAAVAAFVTGLLAIAEAIWDPASRAADSRELEAKYAALNKDATKIDSEELNRALDGLYDSKVAELEALRPVAYNDTVAEFGNSSDAKCQLNRWQRFMAWLTGGISIPQT